MMMITTGAMRKSSTAPASAMTAALPGPRRCPSSDSTSRPPFEDPLEPDDAVVAEEAHQRQREEDDGQRRGERPVERDLALALDQHSDHDVAGAPQPARPDEEAGAQE